MFRRIKILTLLQLSDRIKLKKSNSIKGAFAKTGIFLLSIVVITAICSALIYLLCDLMSIPKNTGLITFVIFFLQIMSIISCTSGLLKTLYLSKDNSILLSYPAHHVEVFLSKLLVFYIYEFIKGVFITLPLLIGFGIMYDIFSLSYVLVTLFCVIVLPLFPVLIGAFLTMPILFINRFLNKFVVIKGALAVGVLAGLFYVIYKVMKLIPVPLRIVALYNTFIMKVTGFITSVNQYSLFYANIAKMLTNNNVFQNLLIVLAVLLGLIVLVAALAMPLYFGLASKSSEQANVKKHRGGNKAHKNTFFTFVKKEWLLSIRNLGDFIGNYAFMFATPYLTFIMASIYSAVDRNILGHQMTIVFVAFLVLILSSASNTASALAITKEGSEFVLLKTAPANTTNMAWAKIFFNIVFSSIMIVISFLVVILFCDRIENSQLLWLMMVAVILINAGLIFWSFQIDIMHPKLREYASNGDTSSFNNAAESIKVGLIVALLFSVLSLIFMMSGAGDIILWFEIIGVALLFLLARTYLFRSYLNNIFPDIEF